MRLAGLAVPAVLLLAAACQPPAPAGLTDQDKAAIQKLTADFAKAVNAKDWAAATATYTDDAHMMPANGPAVSGKAGIQTWMGAYPPFSNFTVGAVEMDGRGDVAYASGTYELDMTPPGGAAAIHDKGKWVEVLRKQADGSWKVSHDIFNSDMPLPMPPAPDTTAKKPVGKRKG